MRLSQPALVSHKTMADHLHKFGTDRYNTNVADWRRMDDI